MSKQCVKCGYVRQASDTAPDYECPKCGVVYAKAETAIAERNAAMRLSVAHMVTTPKTPEELLAVAIKNAEADGKVVCNRCGSDQVSGHVKGFGLGRAVVGGVLVGGVGLLAGLVGRKKMMVYCQRCGHRWVAGHAK